MGRIFIILFVCIYICLHTNTAVFGLPSSGNPGHADLTKMSAKIKHNLTASGQDGLQKAMDDIKDFGQKLSSASVAEDNIIGDGLGGARHFYDPTTGNGYLGLFQNAKDRANDLFKSAIENNCIGLTQQELDYIQKAWEDFGHTLHLMQDMTTPAHTNDVSHITGDSYEEYVNNNWDSWQSDMPAEGKIQKGTDANGKPVYYNGLKDYLADYSNKNPYSPSTYQLSNSSSYVDLLAGESHDSPVDSSMLLFNKPISWADKRRDAEKLLPQAMMYGAGLINTFWAKIKPSDDGGSEPTALPDDCNRPPEPEGPANDHPDDRFDVSDEFYLEKNFNLDLGKLTDLHLRTGIKKGKVGALYFRQVINAVKEATTATTDSGKLAANQKLQALAGKVAGKGGEYRTDWKTAPDVALFANGFYKPSISLMLKIDEPVTFGKMDFNPTIVKDQPVMLVPTGGFYGLENSVAVKAALDEYVKNGGTLVVFAQQHGSDWSLLPTSPDAVTGEKKPVTGYGYQEDQSCQFNSVYIDTYHPMLSGISTSTASIGVDGYFTSYPENSTVLLRRVVNGMPAMILYPYGKGYVIATTLYTDFAFTHSQANQTEINLVQNIVSWAKRPEPLPEIRPGETASLNVALYNFTDANATSVRFTILDPSRGVVTEKTQAIEAAAGQTVTIPYTYASQTSSPIGIYHIDYTLLDAQGNVVQPQAETDSGRFVVSDPPKTGNVANDIRFSISSPNQQVFFNEPFVYTFHIFNNTATPRNLTIKTRLWHTDRRHEWTVTAIPNGETTVTGSDLFLDSRAMYETMRAYLYDESGAQIGSYMLSFKGLYPKVDVTTSTGKGMYTGGETVNLSVNLKNTQSVATAAKLGVTVTDPTNITVYANTLDVSLPAGGTGTHPLSFPLPANTQGGFYTISSEVYDITGNKIGGDATSFELPISQVSIIAVPPVAITTGVNTFSFNLTNNGKISVNSGTLDVTLKDPDGTISATASQPFTLDAGQSKTVDVAISLPLLKFGTYTLTCRQRDETRVSKTINMNTKIINNATINPLFDKPSYRIRETAGLTVELADTGSFNLENASFTVSVPDFGFSETKPVSVPASQSVKLSFAIPLPETVSAGPHDVTLNLASQL